MPFGNKPFENTLDNFLPFSSNLKLSSANSFSLEESKIWERVNCQLIVAFYVFQGTLMALLENKHIQERELFHRLLVHSDSKEDLKQQAAMYTQQQRLEKMTKLKESRDDDVISKFLGQIFRKGQILGSTKLIKFADNNFKFDENDRKFSKRVENNVGREIACYKRFPFSTVFSKDLFCRHIITRACWGKG